MKLYPELTRSVGKNNTIVFSGTILSLVFALFVFAPIVPPIVLYSWATIQFCVLLFRIHIGVKISEISSKTPVLKNYTYVFIFTIGLSGFMWGCAAVFASYYGSLVHQALVIALLASLIGAAVSTAGAIFMAFAVFVIIVVVMQISTLLFGNIVFGGESDGVIEYQLAGLTFLYGIVLFNATKAITVNMMRSEDLKCALKAESIRSDNSNKAKSRFLSSVSHELRTPLHAIIGFTQLLELDSEQDKEEQQDHIDQINSASNHLLLLINQLLEQAKIESSDMVLELVELEINDLMKQCEKMALPLAADYQVNLKVDYLSKSMSIHTDPLKLKQVLINFLSNAMKYNKPGGHVTMSALVHEESILRICIEDDGEGISEDQQEQLFEPFNRLENVSSQQEGTGLGLVIVKETIQQLGGVLGFESVKGEGSKFWIDLEMNELGQEKNN